MWSLGGVQCSHLRKRPLVAPFFAAASPDAQVVVAPAGRSRAGVADCTPFVSARGVSGMSDQSVSRTNDDAINGRESRNRTELINESVRRLRRRESVCTRAPRRA